MLACLCFGSHSLSLKGRRSKLGYSTPFLVVLIGPNGSGKTTLLNALVATARIASSASPTEEKNPIKAFLPFFSPATREEPTQFCVEFDADWLTPKEDRQLFRYELVIERNDAEVQNHSFRNGNFLQKR